MESRPTNGIGREKSASVPGLDSGVSKGQTDNLNLVQQFPAGDTHKVVDWAKTFSRKLGMNSQRTAASAAGEES